MTNWRCTFGAFALCGVGHRAKHRPTEEHWQSHSQNIAFCISNGIRSVDCPGTSFSCRAASEITEGGNRQDGQEYSSGNFLIKKLSTLSHRVAALWIGKLVSIRRQLYYLCSSVPPPFLISASWENKVTPHPPVASTTTSSGA